MLSVFSPVTSYAKTEYCLIASMVLNLRFFKKKGKLETYNLLQDV